MQGSSNVVLGCLGSFMVTPGVLGLIRLHQTMLGDHEELWIGCLNYTPINSFYIKLDLPFLLDLLHPTFFLPYIWVSLPWELINFIFQFSYPRWHAFVLLLPKVSPIVLLGYNLIWRVSAPIWLSFLQSSLPFNLEVAGKSIKDFLNYPLTFWKLECRGSLFRWAITRTRIWVIVHGGWKGIYSTDSILQNSNGMRIASGG